MRSDTAGATENNDSMYKNSLPLEVENNSDDFDDYYGPQEEASTRWKSGIIRKPPHLHTYEHA